MRVLSILTIVAAAQSAPPAAESTPEAAVATDDAATDAAYLAALGDRIRGREKEPAEAVFANIETLRGRPAGAVLAIMEVGYGPIRVSARATLAERGLREVKDGETADLVLEYNAGLADQLTASFAIDVNWWGRLVVVPTGDSNLTAGLAFLFTRAADGEPVWTGWLVQRATNENALIVLRERAPKFARRILAAYLPKRKR